MREKVRRIAAIAAVATLAACADHIVDVTPPPGFAFLLTEPQAAPVPAVLVAGSQTGSDGIIYVSLSPGTVVGGRLAAIRNLGNGFAAATALVDGGFDPVPVVAGVGDSIEVVVTDGSGVAIGRAALVVPPRRPPIVVRTVPPRRGTDVPLNATIQLVFSEPLDPRTVGGASVRLTRGGARVDGTVELSADGLRAEFVPGALLARATRHVLLVSALIADLAGDALGATDSIEFTTTDRSTASPPASITVSPLSLSIPVLGVATLRVTRRDAGGNEVSGGPITWTSADTTVARVVPWSDSSGTDPMRAQVTALRAGSALVTASGDGLSGSAAVTVTSDAGVAVASVTIKPMSRSVLAAGDAFLLTATVRDANGNVLQRGVSWTSSDPSVAWTSANAPVSNGLSTTGGWIRGVKPGTVVVTATSGGVSGTLTVIVGPPRAVASIVLSRPSQTVLIGGTGVLHARLFDADGIEIAKRPITWRSSSASVVSLDTTRTEWFLDITGNAEGTATVTATVEGVTGSAEVRVRQLALASISVGDRAAGDGAGSTWDGNSCGLTTQGEAWCWGGNDYGQLLQGGWNLSRIPLPLPGGLRFASLTTGGAHSCGLTVAGAAWCWGLGWTELGDSLPVAVPGGQQFVSLDIGINQYETCGLTAAGTGYCFSIGASPVAVPGGLTFQSLQVGYNHYCGLTTAGAAYCWGANNYGQLGDGTTTGRTTPVAVSGGHTFVALVSAKWHSCGLTAAGAAWCWGGGHTGQLGNGATSQSSVPVAVGGGITFATLSAEAGADVTCGLTSAGVAYCWGENNAGQLGDGSTVNRSLPVAVSGGLQFASISTSDHSCGVTVAGVAWCWGGNLNGKLGAGTQVDYSTVPVKVFGQP